MAKFDVSPDRYFLPTFDLFQTGSGNNLMRPFAVDIGYYNPMYMPSF